MHYHQFAKDKAPQSCVFTIYCCEADKPPKRKDDKVAELCDITGEWDKPFDEWKAVVAVGGLLVDGGWRKHDDLALAMRFPGTQPIWAMTVGANEFEHPVTVEYMS